MSYFASNVSDAPATAAAQPCRNGSVACKYVDSTTVYTEDAFRKFKVAGVVVKYHYSTGFLRISDFNGWLDASGHPSTRLVEEWLLTDEAHAMIQAVKHDAAPKYNSTHPLVIIRKAPEGYKGLYVDPKLAVWAAGWLNPHFAIIELNILLVYMADHYRPSQVTATGIAQAGTYSRAEISATAKMEQMRMELADTLAALELRDRELVVAVRKLDVTEAMTMSLRRELADTRGLLELRDRELEVTKVELDTVKRQLEPMKTVVSRSLATSIFMRDTIDRLERELKAAKV